MAAWWKTALCAVTAFACTVPAHSADFIKYTLYAKGSGYSEGYNQNGVWIVRPLYEAVMSFYFIPTGSSSTLTTTPDGVNWSFAGSYFGQGGGQFGSNPNGIGFYQSGNDPTGVFSGNASGSACFATPTPGPYPTSGVDLPPGGCGTVSANLLSRFGNQFFTGNVYAMSVEAGSSTGARNGFSSIVLSVPEPTTWAMMLLGFGALGATMRMRRRKLALA
jgi:hypothetical protein